MIDSIHVRDSSRAGEDGRLPPDFAEWRQGVTYTVRPDLLRPLPANVERRLNVTVRHVVTSEAAPWTTYDPLYQRAVTLIRSRMARLRCVDASAALRTWILAHAWFLNERGQTRVYSASLTCAAMFVADGRVTPDGEELPDAAALGVPSGGTAEAFASKHRDDTGARRLDEMYVDFSRTDPGRDVTVSYGEYTTSGEDVDFTAVVARAEALAAFHFETLTVPEGSVKAPFEILRREWECLATNKVTDPSIATVHLCFRI